MMSWLPENVSTYGGEIDSLFYLIYYITLVTFLLVAVTMVWFLIRYRHREGRRAKYTHGSNTLEVIWTIVPAVILVVLAFMGQSVWGRVKISIPPGDLQVRVVAKQFNWEMVYPGPDGKFGTQDDRRLENEMHVPVHKVVRVGLLSEDVIHSFFLPNLRLKQDAVPGREIPSWFEATKPGTYEIPCAELCGFGHSGMKGKLIVHSADDYAKWVKKQWPSS
ncbi:MAG: cytochrome c oxidase subunit II [Candidatus Tectomicrobia bacterium]|nr:cytochrome c oxidase subunit II [Candidatus Tectomicrobia bacterium]